MEAERGDMTAEIDIETGRGDMMRAAETEEAEMKVEEGGIETTAEVREVQEKDSREIQSVGIVKGMVIPSEAVRVVRDETQDHVVMVPVVDAVMCVIRIHILPISVISERGGVTLVKMGRAF